MCEFFYQQRRNPQPEMDERGAPIPTMRELYKYIKTLSNRLEKTEKELEKLKIAVNSRQKRAILSWLNKPSQTPNETFEDWFRNIKATETDMIKALNSDLTEGILSCLNSAIMPRTADTLKLPIRCFKQKPNTFYVYSLKPSQADEEVKAEWKIMSADQCLKMLNNISRDIRRKYNAWERDQIRIRLPEEDEYDHVAMDKAVKYEKKLNADIEKLVQNIKKVLFSKLEEDMQVIIEIDFD